PRLAASRRSRERWSSAAKEPPPPSHRLPHRPEDLLRIPRRLLDRLHPVQQLVELPRQLLRRLHRHDLILDELEGVLDQVELPLRERQVAADLLHLVEALQEDREVLSRDLGLR